VWGKRYQVGYALVWDSNNNIILVNVLLYNYILTNCFIVLKVSLKTRQSSQRPEQQWSTIKVCASFLE